jgi:uracil-DNA glycosylase
MPNTLPLLNLLENIQSCRYCEKNLPLGPRPVLQVSSGAKILIIGQAPGSKVHASGIPWDDPSGKRLRQWMGVSAETFYNPDKIAIIPMGFCYPGKGKSGDLPPRKECAPQWHQALLEQLRD